MKRQRLKPGLLRDAATILVLAYLVAWGIHIVGTLTRPRQTTRLLTEQLFPLSEARSAGDRVVVLATSRSCPFSRKSMAFHRRLVSASHSHQIPTVIVSRRLANIPPELMSLLQPSDRVVEHNLASSGITGTPAVVLLEAGRVKGVWTGLLNASQEQAVLSRVDGSLHTLTKGDDLANVVQLSQPELAARLKGALVLDIRTRDQFNGRHLEGAENIPADELAARMQVELHPHGNPIIIDCSALDMGVCVLHGGLLTFGGFKGVWLLDSGAVGASCSYSPPD